MVNLNYLRIPMQALLYDITDVDAFTGLPAANIALLKKQYPDEHIKNLVAALQFAVDHPEFDFVSLMPDLAQTNEKIHLYLCKIHASLRDATAA